MLIFKTEFVSARTTIINNVISKSRKHKCSDRDDNRQNKSQNIKNQYLFSLKVFIENDAKGKEIYVPILNLDLKPNSQ